MGEKIQNNRARKISVADKEGFVLPFSVLVSGILLAVGLTIFSITLKELTLSSGSRESRFAFYAADTGIECALFWDIRHPDFSISVFATSSSSSEIPEGSEVFCNEEDITVKETGWNSSGWDIVSDNDSAETLFDMKFDNDSCATVVVKKESNTTSIESRGFNICDLNNPRRVERGLRVRY